MDQSASDDEVDGSANNGGFESAVFVDGDISDGGDHDAADEGDPVA